MNILITGANGFLGRSIRSSNILKQHKLFFTSRKELDVLDKGSLFDYLLSNEINVIIHTAVVGHPGQDGVQTLQHNLKADLNILQSHKLVDKIIIFGSGAEYTYGLTDYYGFGKYTTSCAARCIDNVYNLRLFGCFGPEENDTRFIKSNLARYKNNKPIKIDQDLYMDFIYIDDLLLLVNRIINKEYSNIQEINCVYEKKYKLSDIADIINNQNEHKVPIKTPTWLQGYLGQSYSTPAENILFFQLKFKGLEQGIREMYNEEN